MAGNPPRAFLRPDAWLAILIIALGMWLRVSWEQRSILWCDEAESCINALTIQQVGVPSWKYLDLPIYENMLTEPWHEHPEYEFRDSSYSPKGVAVYHGWLPLYAIAASQAIFGIKPDHPENPPRVLHGSGELRFRTFVPRLPSLIFAFACLVLTFLVGRAIGGPTAGLAALTLTAFNARSVDFGIQARYYSLTLLASVAAAGALWMVASRGRWRDFLLLGLCAAILFHTHQFSALIFSVAALFAIPAVIKQPGWLWKSIAGASLSAMLVLPWIVFSGFLNTASHVPKGYNLFDSWTDWFYYCFERRDQLAVLGLLVFIVLLSRFRPKWFFPKLVEIVASHRGIYIYLLAWLLTGYLGFHVIVPAASFFYERLSLVLWTPYVFLLSVALSDVLRWTGVRRAGMAAVITMTAFLGLRGRLAFTQGTAIPYPHNFGYIVVALASQTYPAGTKFYASPNSHLTITYFTGLPVQSVAVPRRSFLDTYDKPVVFIEGQYETFFPLDETLRGSVPGGDRLTQDELLGLGSIVWQHLTVKNLARRGLDFSPAGKIPETLLPAMQETSRIADGMRDAYLKNAYGYPPVRGIKADNLRDLWLGFFVRFADPESRIGVNQNIAGRLKNSTATFVPLADTVIFRSDLPVRPDETGTSMQMP